MWPTDPPGEETSVDQLFQNKSMERLAVGTEDRPRTEGPRSSIRLVGEQTG